MKVKNHPFEMVLLDSDLKETSDPDKAAMLVINGVKLPTNDEVYRRVWQLRSEVDMLETLQKILFVVSILVNAGLTILLLSMK